MQLDLPLAASPQTLPGSSLPTTTDLVRMIQSEVKLSSLSRGEYILECMHQKLHIQESKH